MQKNNNLLSFHFWAMAAEGKGISGGDRIFIEFARRWSKRFPITIHLWKEGYEMCERQGLASKNITFKVYSTKPWVSLGYLINYFARIFVSLIKSANLSLKEPRNVVIYSCSEFWMDSLPALLLKLRFGGARWVAAWYQTAPKPWRGYAEGNREKKYNLKALLYWFVQFSVKPLITKYADLILVNNKEEVKEFSGKKKGEVLVVFGAVDVEKIEEWKKKFGSLDKKYDAVFQGRFHPQKGVLELIDIWKRVILEKPKAKLAMIGDGPLMEEVKEKIKKLRLENNITLFGYVFDGPVKYGIFARSKIVVHPAFYDSGGMASAEAMSFGIPCVGFDLKAYESYYPEGMIKVRLGDLGAFAHEIVSLLEEESKRKRIGEEARNMIKRSWSWTRRAEEVLDKTLSI